MKNVLLLFSIVILFAIQSCKDSSNPGMPTNNNFVYPLKIGNTWNYRESNTFCNPRPDSIRYLLNDFFYNVVVTVTRDTVLDSIPVFEIQEILSDSIRNFESFGYYANTQEGLIKYAYTSGGYLGLPKANHSTQFFFKGSYYNSITELIKELGVKITSLRNLSDSLYYFQPPRVIYKYPLIENSEWALSEEGIYINKEVEGKTILQTSLGFFECYKIKWKYDLDKDGNWDEDFFVYEYLNAKGKLKIVYTIKDMVVTTSEYPDGIGKVDVNFEQIITGINF